MDEIEVYGFQIIYLASAITLTWIKPIQSTLTCRPNEYRLWLKYWSVLSFVVLLEVNFLTFISSNLGYYFIRTLFFFFLSEKSFSSDTHDYTSYILKKIGAEKDFRSLAVLLDNDIEVHMNGKLHPWAPNPINVAGLAVCKIGELCQENSITASDQKFLVNGPLETIVSFLDSPEDAVSINALLSILFLSEKEYIKNKLVTLAVFSRLEGLIKHKSKQVSLAALRLCSNLYSLNKELQKEFIRLGFCSHLVGNLRSSDPLCVFETLDNVFSLFIVRFM